MPYTENRIGHQPSETSFAAAKSMEPTAGTLRHLVLDVIRRAKDAGMTADEAANALAVSPLAVRPRVTELNTQRLIIDSGKRRANASGRRATVWVVS